MNWVICISITLIIVLIIRLIVDLKLIKKRKIRLIELDKKEIKNEIYKI